MPGKKTVVALIFSPDELLVNYSKSQHLAVSPPLGLAYLASYIRNLDNEVHLLDSNAMGFGVKEVAEWVRRIKPDIVGISIYTAMVKTSSELAKAVKEISKDIIVVAGGPHIHFMAREFLSQCRYFDYAVRGEGEVTFGELIKCLKAGQNPSGVLGLTYFDKTGRLVEGADRPFIKDLDLLPLPAYDLLPMERYSATQVLKGARPFSIIMTSRGCPFNCHYCSSSVSWGRQQRRRSPENVIREIKKLRDKYHVKALRFEDDLFTLQADWAGAICDQMIKEGLNTIRWEVNTRIGTFDSALLKKMKQAGCVSVSFGIEFGNQGVLDFCKKNLKLQDIKPAIRTIKRTGLRSKAFFMIGHPVETRDNIKETIRFAKTCGIDYAVFSVVTPFPGTELFEYCNNNNLLVHRDWEFYQFGFTGQRPLRLPHITNEELEKLYHKAVKEFYFHPVRVVNCLINHPLLILQLIAGKIKQFGHKLIRST